jgi:hypothetical protein
VWSKLFGSKSGSDKPVSSGQNLLTFNDGKSALEYIAKFMRTEWRESSIVTGLAGPIVFERGVFSVPVLVPKYDNYEQVGTMTTIKAISSPGKVPIVVWPSTRVADIGLAQGDLVAVLLVQPAPRELADFTNWVAFLVGRLDPVYDMNAGGWRTTHRYEL